MHRLTTATVLTKKTARWNLWSIHVMLLFCALILVARSSMSGAAGQPYRFLSNAPFDARATGLVGAIGVEVGEETRGVEIDRAVRQSLERVHTLAEQRRRERLEQFLRRARLLKPNQRIRFDRRVVLTRHGQPILPIRDAAARSNARFGNGSINFNFSGWSPSDESQLRSFVSQAMPVLQSVYGSPATNITVTILQDQDAASLMDGGVYNVTTKVIHLPPLTNVQFSEFELTHLILHAFHDELQFSFDAWEEGFARAAALLAFLRIDSTFDPLADPLYQFPRYEGMNQPSLGNSTFFPSSHFEGMAPWRLGAAQAAWLKVAAENPGFFSAFNAAYYAQFHAGLEGDTPALKQMAQSIAPTVEGLSFTDWYRRQFILDTSNSTGQKLFVANFPQPISVILVIEQYLTDPTGNETPASGAANLVYRNDESNDLFAEEGNTAPIENGEGFIAPQFFNIGGANRIFVDVTAGAVQMTIVYPYNVVHESALGNPDNIFGAALGSDTGSITIQAAGRALPETATIARGVFAFPPDIPMVGLARWTFTYTATDTGQTVTVRQNTGFGYSVLLFQSPVSVSTLTHTFTKGTTGLQMASLPGRPLVSDEAAIFGVSPNRFLMARWRAQIPGDNKYELYPNITVPLGPGVGAWVKLEKDVNVSVQIEPVAGDTNFQINLPPGFSQIGPPSDSAINLSDLSVVAPGGVIQDFGSAQAAGLISGAVYGYSQTDGYKLVTSISGWNAYWFRVTSVNGVSLVFPKTGGRLNRAIRTQSSVIGRRIRHAPRLPAPIGLDKNQMKLDNWSFKISALTSVINDRDNYIGVTSGATDALDNVYDIVKPPLFGGFVALYFSANSGQGIVPLAADIRAPFAGKKEWDFLVTTNLGDLNVTLTWDDLKPLPRSLRILLTDLDTTATRNMRAINSYTYRTGNSATRRFRVTVDSGPPPPVRFQNVAFTRGPRGYVLSFNASQPVQVTAEIFAAATRKVRTLQAVPSSATGDYVLLWDLQDDRGRRVVPGAYFVRLTVIDEQHRLFRLIRMVRVGM